MTDASLESELSSVRRELAVAQDTLSHRTAELKLLFEIAFYAQQDPDTPTILRAFLRSVCTHCNWPFGHVLMPDKDDEDVLVSTQIWEVNDGFDGTQLAAACSGLRFGPGEGAPGRVLEIGSLVYAENINDNQLSPRQKLYEDQDLKTSFAVPVRAFGKIVAVTEFFSKSTIEKDDEFLRIVETAALQLGTGIDRRESEVQLRQNVENLENLNAELTNAKDQLVQSEKLISIGQLAAGIAHEINNPLSFVVSNVQTVGNYTQSLTRVLALYDKLAAAIAKKDSKKVLQLAAEVEKLRAKEDIEFVVEDLQDLLHESTAGMDRVKDIVEGLKAFARTDSGELEQVDVNDILDLTLKMVSNELKYTCEIVRESEELPLLTCSPGKLGQVFTNLLVNAGHAIQDSGVITLRSRVVDACIQVQVQDSGSGIEPEKINDIFNPFFTTKPVGQGTGLGLSISYGIVTDHGGKIEVESELGKGTCFTVSLPIEPVSNNTDEQELHLHTA